MWRDSLLLLQFILPMSSVDFVLTDLSSMCEVECYCTATSDCSNHFPCCPEDMTAYREPQSPSRDRNGHATKKKRSSVVQTWQNQTCIYPFIHITPLPEEFEDVLNEYPFRVIHGCRGNHTGSDLHTKCLDFRNISTLEKLIPVVDPNTMTIYANRFCAECNDVRDFEAFRYELVCRNALLGNWEFLSLDRTQENLMNLVRSGLCVFYLQPPDRENPIIVYENRCVQAIYSHCNETGDAVTIAKTNRPHCLPTLSLQDNNECAFCSDQSGHYFSGKGQSESHILKSMCNNECITSHKVLSFSFFILMSIDEALIATSDDRIMEPRDVKCGNQSNDIYDKFMV